MMADLDLARVSVRPAEVSGVWRDRQLINFHDC